MTKDDGQSGTPSTTDASPAAATGTEVLERIVESNHNIVLLDTTDGVGCIERLRQLVRRSGQALYVWHAESGLLSLREGGMAVPGARRLTDALRFVRRSMHFGIYLFAGAASSLRPQDMVLLTQIARLRDGPTRRVVLMDHDAEYLEPLHEVSLHLRISGSDQQPPRLRDGRWVRA